MADEEKKETAEAGGQPPKPEEAKASETGGEAKEAPVSEKKAESGKKEAKPIVGGSDELEEKQVKRAFLDKFRKKKGAKVLEETESSTTTSEASSSDEVAERIYQQLAHNEAQEYFVLKVKKKKLLIFLGFIIFVLWVGFFVNYFMHMKGLAYPWDKNGGEESAEATASANIVTEQDDGVKVRIRNINGDEEGAVQLAQLLQSKGYEAVEVLEDTESDFDGVAIVVKPDAEGVRSEIQAVVEELYQVSSPSAELTVDSDFDAVILYAPAERAANTSTNDASSATGSAEAQN